MEIKIRLLGQRCDHCKKKFNTPTFKKKAAGEISWFLLVMILEGMFDIFDEDIQLPNEDERRWFQYGRRGRGGRGGRGVVEHLVEFCEACEKNK